MQDIIATPTLKTTTIIECKCKATPQTGFFVEQAGDSTIWRPFASHNGQRTRLIDTGYKASKNGKGFTVEMPAKEVEGVIGGRASLNTRHCNHVLDNILSDAERQDAMNMEPQPPHADSTDQDGEIEGDWTQVYYGDMPTGMAMGEWVGG